MLEKERKKEKQKREKCGIDNDRDGYGEHPFPSHLGKMAVVLCSFIDIILQLTGLAYIDDTRKTARAQCTTYTYTINMLDTSIRVERPPFRVFFGFSFSI